MQVSSPQQLVPPVVPAQRLRGQLNSIVDRHWPAFVYSPEMSIELDHTIVAARDRRASAQLLASILAVAWSEQGVGPFCPVYVNDGLTLDIDQAEGAFPVQHFCFRVSEPEFDAIVGRLRSLGIKFRSTPHGPVDMLINTAHGGRIVYWSEPDGHVWEALTVSYARSRDDLSRGA